MFRHFFIFVLLISASVNDVKSLQIPDKYPVLIALINLFSCKVFFSHGLAPFGLHFITALFCAALKKTMPLGFGDIKLFGALGLGLDLEKILFLSCSSFFLSGLFSLFYVVFSEAEDKFHKEIPFAPFICAAYALLLLKTAIWFPEQI